jgi:hypothetical protein
MPTPVAFLSFTHMYSLKDQRPKGIGIMAGKKNTSSLKPEKIPRGFKLLHTLRGHTEIITAAPCGGGRVNRPGRAGHFMPIDTSGQ